MKELLTIDCGEIFLREYTIEDVGALYELTLQPEVHEFLPDFKSTKEQRLEWVKDYEIPQNKSFLASVPAIEEDAYLRLGIFLKETGKFIGFCMTGVKPQLPKPNREIVYAISKKYSGKGYTSSAVKTLITYLFKETNVEQLNAIALPHNIGSNKVIQKVGFLFKETIDIDNQKYHYYTLQKSDWKDAE